MPDVFARLAESKADSQRLKAWIAVAVSCGSGLAGGLLCLAALRIGPDATVAAAAAVAFMAAGAGHAFGSRHGPVPNAVRAMMFRVADELAQYRAFTRLLRDQGHSIVETTASATTSLGAGLTGMDGHLARLAAEIERGNTAIDRERVVQELRAIADPVVGMLGTLQFQDVTQQQIEFLNRLSLILDDHLTLLSKLLGGRRDSDRIAGFREMFDLAREHCVMDVQRNDHRAAMGLEVREEAGLKVELF